MTAIVYNVFWRYAASGRRLILASVPDREVHVVTRSFLAGPIVYTIAAGLAFASVWASVAICGAISLSYALPATRWLGLRG